MNVWLDGTASSSSSIRSDQIRSDQLSSESLTSMAHRTSTNVYVYIYVLWYDMGYGQSTRERERERVGRFGVVVLLLRCCTALSTPSRLSRRGGPLFDEDYYSTVAHHHVSRQTSIMPDSGSGGEWGRSLCPVLWSLVVGRCIDGGGDACLTLSKG